MNKDDINVRLYFKNRVETQAFIIRILNNAKLKVAEKSIVFSVTETPSLAHITVGFYTNDDIVTKLGKKFDGLSAATTSGKHRKIYFNSYNFVNPPSHYPNPRTYRRYLVLHEFMHALGVNHVKSCTGCVCSIMTPQTKLINCQANGGLLASDRVLLDKHFNLRVN